MICSKCNTKNIVKAKYCKKCKKEFSDEEREKAYNKTIWHKLEKIEEWYNHLTLETITGHILFKIGSLLIVLGIGIYYWLTIGINTCLLQSKDYDVYHNKEKNEYYLLLKEEKDNVDLNLYVPNRVKELSIKHYNLEGKEKDNLSYEEGKELSLKAFDDDYYILTSKYSKKEKDEFKIIVYRKSDIEEN